MNNAEVVQKLALIGLTGKVQTTGDSRYVRIYIMQGTVSLGRITMFEGKYSHVKWYEGVAQGYDINNRRPLYAWDLLLQQSKVLTDELWFGILESAQRLQQEDVARLEQWRRDNPARLDRNGVRKRRRGIKGRKLSACVRDMLNLQGFY